MVYPVNVEGRNPQTGPGRTGRVKRKTEKMTFTKNKQTGKYDVIGLADQMEEGATVAVTKADGSTSTVTLGRVSRPFTGKFGQLKGKRCAIASIASSGSGYRRSSNYTPGYGRECSCGWGDDLLSFGGYVPGKTYRCPHCGGKADAC